MLISNENFQDRFLAFPPEQHPIILQIGGSNLKNLAKAAQLANAYSYDEINFKLLSPGPFIVSMYVPLRFFH